MLIRLCLIRLTRWFYGFKDVIWLIGFQKRYLFTVATCFVELSNNSCFDDELMQLLTDELMQLLTVNRWRKMLSECEKAHLACITSAFFKRKIAWLAKKIHCITAFWGYHLKWTVCINRASYIANYSASYFLF